MKIDKSYLVKDAMDTTPYLVQKGSPVKKALDLIESTDTFHVLIVDENEKLSGILSSYDLQIIKNWGTTINLKSAERYNNILFNSLLVEERMNKDVITVSPNDTLQRCTELLTDYKFHSLPVLDGDKIVGIITTHNLLRFVFLR